MSAIKFNTSVSPSASEFKTLSKKHNLIVLSYRFFSDWLTPLSIYYRLTQSMKGESFLLESVEGEEKVCRYSFLGCEPLCTFRSKGKRISIRTQGARSSFTTPADPLFELKKLMKGYSVAPRQNLRFFGGFVGYFGYDGVRFYEPIGGKLPETLDVDDAYFMLPKFLIIFDHLKQQIEILLFAAIKNRSGSSNVYREHCRQMEKLYRMITAPVQLPALDFSRRKLNVRSNFSRKKFAAAVNTAKDHIRNGDIIQVVLSQRFTVDFSSDPFTAYRYLRILNPSPYMFYLRLDGLAVAGSSPEMLVRCENGELITRPIAGTRPRGRDERSDNAFEQSLLSDPKEKAEHIMLVDLARNDVGRVAERASVRVPVFMKIERFSHVMHIVSEVRGKLAAKENIFSSLVSCFPAGTVSGAPKVRAMQIINELEPDSRGIYAGSVGYFSFTNSLDTCIIIRTIVFKGSKAYVQAGAGIVADSVPDNEYRETMNKARAQFLALEFAA